MTNTNAIMGLEEARREAEMYRGMYETAQERVRTIEERLAQEYRPSSDRNYPAEEVRKCRMGIVAFLTDRARPCSLWEIQDALFLRDKGLVQRELHKLAARKDSNISWNRRRGPASRYARVR